MYVYCTITPCSEKSERSPTEKTKDYQSIFNPSIQEEVSTKSNMAAVTTKHAPVVEIPRKPIVSRGKKNTSSDI